MQYLKFMGVESHANGKWSLENDISVSKVIFARLKLKGPKVWAKPFKWALQIKTEEMNDLYSSFKVNNLLFYQDNSSVSCF